MQSNLSIRTRKPLHYGKFVWSQQKCQKSYITYLHNTDTSVKRTLGSVPLVSVLKRFDCKWFTAFFNNMRPPHTKNLINGYVITFQGHLR